MISRTVAVLRPQGAVSRISEGDFIRLRDGRILFACSRFQDPSDDAWAEVVGYTSDDEGETWSEPEVLLRPETLGVKNVMSVNLLRMAAGDIGLFVVAKPDARIYRIFLVRSGEDELTFSRVTDCQKDMAIGQYVLNNSRVVRLSSGRILVPLAYHRTSAEPGRVCKDARAVALMLYSDDDGETWQEGQDTISMPFPSSRSGLQEPGVLEMRDHTLWAYFRTDLHAQYEAFSRDGGMHWTGAQPSRFTSPLSPMKLLRAPDGSLIAVWNPVPNYNGRLLSPAGWGRTPLVMARSTDEGVSWSEAEVIEKEEGHGYCYPAGFFTRDGQLLLAYCSGGPEEGSCLARTTIRKIRIQDGFCGS